MRKFKLNTAVVGTSRIKGWSATSDLDQTVSKATQDEIPELIEAIKNELAKAVAKRDADNSEYDKINTRCFELRVNRTTRANMLRKVSARSDRSFNKVHALESALVKLTK